MRKAWVRREVLIFQSALGDARRARSLREQTSSSNPSRDVVNCFEGVKDTNDAKKDAVNLGTALGALLSGEKAVDGIAIFGLVKLGNDKLIEWLINRFKGRIVKEKRVDI